MSKRESAPLLDIISLLMWSPRTTRDLVDMGVMKNTANLWLQALHVNGLVYIKEYRATGSKPAAVWAWQRVPYEMPDAVRQRKDATSPPAANAASSATT